MGDVQLPPGQNWYDMEEVAKHNKESDAWVVVMGNVINVTHFLNLHPGGKPILLEKAGTDATEMFLTIHPPGTLEKHAQDKIIGKIKGWVPPEPAEEADEAIWMRNDVGGGPLWFLRELINKVCGCEKAELDYAKKIRATYGPREERTSPEGGNLWEREEDRKKQERGAM